MLAKLKKRKKYDDSADKGKATLVMDTDKYEQKVTTMLSDDKTYDKLKKDPTQKYKRKLVSIIRKLKEEGTHRRTV